MFEFFQCLKVDEENPFLTKKDIFVGYELAGWVRTVKNVSNPNISEKTEGLAFSNTFFKKLNYDICEILYFES